MVQELAHQWFGSLITCGSWRDIWLNEGFATYFTVFGLQIMNPYWGELLLREKINHVCLEPGGSVIVDDTSSTERIFNPRLSYSKGAMVLHMLRWEIGDYDFFSTISNYLADTTLINSYASTDDFKKHAEVTSGKNLDEFFADWVYGQGYPMYNIEWLQSEDNQFHIRIDQDQSHHSVDFFEMHLPVQLFGEGKDTIIVVYNYKNLQEETYDISFNIDSIRFDPESKIVTKNPIVQHKEIIHSDDICFYPIPTFDKLYYRLPDGFIAEELIVYNELNIAVLIKKTVYQADYISLKGLPSGIYYAFFKEKNQAIIKKIVKL
jgi:aminopeptidase N